MNNWKAVWEKRTINDCIMKDEDTFNKFCELKRVDGFDTNTEGEYYKHFWNQWFTMYNELNMAMHGQPIKSVYEVGCGSGVNLFMFQKNIGNYINVAGNDYSQPLVTIAKSVLGTDEIYYCEASQIDTDIKYDLVISDSVFQYFPDIHYGMEVLEKMYQKAKFGLYVSEIHDLEKKEECINYRKKLCEDYDEKYKGLDKTFYAKSLFLSFADSHNCDIKLTQNRNPYYWNSKFIYNCFIFKNSGIED